MVIFPNVPQSSQTESLGFPNYHPLPLDTPGPLRTLELGVDGKSDVYQFNVKLGGGFKYFLFSPLLGEDSHFD